MKSRIALYSPFILILLITIGWGVFFYYVSPVTIVHKIGIQNSYIVGFFMAVICGFSSVTGTTFYATIAALSHGGVNPLILGISGGVGLCISDYAFYFLVSKGTHIIDKHWSWVSKLIKKIMEKFPMWVLYVFIFIYSGFIPIPNDILLVTLAIGGIKFPKIAPYVFAGDIVSTLILTYLSH